MDTKLTLKLDTNIIERAKNYAKENNLSLSKLIENYLHAVTVSKESEVKASPLVESLTGVIKTNEEEYRKDYTDFLLNKYS